MVKHILFLLAFLSAINTAVAQKHRRARHLNPAHAGAGLVLDTRFLNLANGDSITTFTGRAASENATASGTARPTYTAAAQGGAPAATFDGSTDVMTLSGTQFVRTDGAFFVLAVYKVASDAGSFPTIVASVNDQSETWRTFASSNSNYNDQAFGANSANWTRQRFTVSAYGAWHLVAITYNGSGATTAANYSAATDGASKSISASSPFASDTTAAGAFGAQANGNNKFKGDIGCVSVGRASLSASLLRRLTHAAAFSWKLPSS
jgi:hypothetical protein